MRVGPRLEVAYALINRVHGGNPGPQGECSRPLWPIGRARTNRLQRLCFQIPSAEFDPKLKPSPPPLGLVPDFGYAIHVSLRGGIDLHHFRYRIGFQ